MTRWQAHRRALLAWGVAAAVLSIVLTLMSRSNSALLDLGVVFDIIVGFGFGLAAFASVALPSTIAVAVARNATQTFVVGVHVAMVFFVVLAIWVARG